MGDNKELEEKIAQQMKYYFSDFNLSRDKFMKEELKKDDGWITIAVLLTFKRLASLTTDPMVVAAAVKSYAADLLEVDEESTKIRRSPANALPASYDEYREKVLQRTLHIKGFPLESTFDQLWSYFIQYGALESLLLRKKRKGSFKGCVLAVFKNQEDADKLLEENLTYNEKPLLKEKEEAHLARKKEYFENRKNSKKGKGKERDGNRGKRKFNVKNEEQENVQEDQRDIAGDEEERTPKKVKLEPAADPSSIKVKNEPEEAIDA